MPKIPKILGELMNFMFSKVTVTFTEMISPSVKLVRFKGVFPKVNFKIGQAIILKVNDTNYRNYTPSEWDSKSGTFEVIFHIHHNGPGSSFIENLQINDQVNIVFPRGFNIYNQEAKYHFLFGDETCLSVFRSLKNQINGDSSNYLGILELDSSSFEVPIKLGIQLDAVSKSVNKGEFAVEALYRIESTVWNLWSNGFFYLMGNAKSIQKFKAALKEKGVSNKNIYTQPFWSEGKIGL
jgi:NADPH-dependent ferric siderophore reductase